MVPEPDLETTQDSTPTEAGIEWLRGDGKSHRYFGPESKFSKEFAEGDGAKTFEEFLYAKFKGEPVDGDSVTNFDYKFTWSRAFSTSNSAEHFVGSWQDGFATVKGGMINFTVFSTQGVNSLAFGRQLGEAGFSGVSNFDTGETRKPLSNMYLRIEWQTKVRN